jgi:hypothetical protein
MQDLQIGGTSPPDELSAFLAECVSSLSLTVPQTTVTETIAGSSVARSPGAECDLHQGTAIDFAGDAECRTVGFGERLGE